MLQVAITFDYELFFGENNATSEEILFAPTYKLLDLLDKYNIKATFFADVLSVYMHTKEGLEDYSTSFTRQIQNMVSRGHDVQLHIHSNWLKSKYNGTQWEFDIDSYRIHTFGFDKNNDTSAYSIIKWGKDYLENTLQPINPDYKCIAYRAGGYCIQPHTELFNALKENGIYIDSSIAMGQKANNINVYDYTKIPEINGWWIDVDSELEIPAQKKENAIYEVPIGYVKNSLIRRFFCPKTEKDLVRTSIKGTYIGSKSSANSIPQKKSKFKILSEYNKNSRILTLDRLNYKLIYKKLKQEALKSNKHNSIAIIGHPKLIDDLWLENFENLLSNILANNEIKTTIMSNLINI